MLAEFRNTLLELSVSFEKFLRFFGAYVPRNSVCYGLPHKRTKKVGRRSNAAKAQANLADPFPVKEKQRRRCVRCASRKKERRTRILCQK